MRWPITCSAGSQRSCCWSAPVRKRGSASKTRLRPVLSLCVWLRMIGCQILQSWFGRSTNESEMILKIGCARQKMEERFRKSVRAPISPDAREFPQWILLDACDETQLCGSDPLKMFGLRCGLANDSCADTKKCLTHLRSAELFKVLARFVHVG